MNELSLTEDKIAKVREHYNAQVEEYRRFTRKFPNIIFLNIVSYKLIDYKRLDYQSTVNDMPKNLLR